MHFRDVNFNFQELDRVSTGILALQIRIPRKKYGGHWVELVNAYGHGGE